MSKSFTAYLNSVPTGRMNRKQAMEIQRIVGGWANWKTSSPIYNYDGGFTIDVTDPMRNTVNVRNKAQMQDIASMWGR